MLSCMISKYIGTLNTRFVTHFNFAIRKRKVLFLSSNMNILFNIIQLRDKFSVHIQFKYSQLIYPDIKGNHIYDLISIFYSPWRVSSKYIPLYIYIYISKPQIRKILQIESPHAILKYQKIIWYLLNIGNFEFNLHHLLFSLYLYDQLFKKKNATNKTKLIKNIKKDSFKVREDFMKYPKKK